MTCLLGSGNKVREISALLLHNVHCACLSSRLQANHNTLQHTRDMLRLNKFLSPPLFTSFSTLLCAVNCKVINWAKILFNHQQKELVLSTIQLHKSEIPVFCRTQFWRKKKEPQCSLNEHIKLKWNGRMNRDLSVLAWHQKYNMRHRTWSAYDFHE